jgi:endonuclease/exonuclease/phosphatase family metal-dependent hydrolase
MQVMTFNVKGAFFNDGQNNWEHRFDLNLATIRRYAPDLIGFQEVQARNLESYQQHLTEYAYELGPDTARENSTQHGYFNAICWNPQRLEKLATGSFFLSQTPEDYSRDWGGSEARGVNWVKFRDRQSGQVFLHLNSHFPHDSEPARLESVDVVAEQLAAWGDGLPVLMTADFNTRAEDTAEMDRVPEVLREWVQRAMPPAGVVYARCQQHGFRDTFLGVGHVPTSTTNTYHHFLGADFPPLGYRIDWVLTRNGTHEWRTQSCEIITDAAPPLYPSDHYPVLAAVELG